MPKIKKLNLGQQVLVALIFGILCGIFFGDYCASLKMLGDAVIKLIQITVLPYILISLLHGIGRLSPEKAKTLALKAGSLLLLFWAVGLLVIFVVPLVTPNWETASFYSRSAVHTAKSIDVLDVYIPSNIFFSLTNNLVPAVVLFSVLGGIALMNLPNKDELLKQLEIGVNALTNMTNYVAAFLPIGIFAIAANAAGTMGVEEFDRLAVYFAMYLLAAALLTFWVIPACVSIWTPFRYYEVLSISKDAFITAFAAGNLFIILPILSQNSKALLRKHDMESQDTQSIIDILVPIVFCFPLLGKLILLLFIVFSGWYSGSPIDMLQYPALAISGVFAMFGHDVVAITFLMDMFKIPHDLFQMYLLTTIVSARFSTLLDAMMIFALITLATCFILNLAKFRMSRLITYVSLTVMITVTSVAGTKVIMNTFVTNEYNKDELLASMQLTATPVEAVVHQSPAKTAPTFFKEPVLERILARGVMRVGYNPTRLPFSFFNGRGDLVGFDIDMAHMLAREIGVKLEFFPIDEQTMKESLDKNLVDVVMAGTPLSGHTLSQMKVSDPYLDLTMAVVVPDHLRQEFATIDKIQSIRHFKLAVVEDKFIQEIVQEAVPNAEVESIATTGEFFTSENRKWQAVLTTAEEGSAWSLLYPDYQVVVPEPLDYKIPLVYPVASHDPLMARFVSLWIDIQKKHGRIERLYDYWISGEGAEKKGPRWSIIRNVLHLVE